MNKAFTLLELLVVIGIMGLLGTVSVGGYRAMQRGMEERGVMQNVTAFVRTAYERAQIDRQPTAIFFWNETLRDATEDETEIVVGKAVAVRCQGRLSAVSGNLLADEFADLNLAYKTSGDDDDLSSEGGSAADVVNTMHLYCLDDVENSGGDSNLAKYRSVVSSRVWPYPISEQYMLGQPQATGNDEELGKLNMWAFKKVVSDSVAWRAGSAYGLEFAELTLPANYIFGGGYSRSVKTPVLEAGVMSFRVGLNEGNGVTGTTVYGSVIVSALRPDSSGSLKANRIAQIGSSDVQ